LGSLGNKLSIYYSITSLENAPAFQPSIDSVDVGKNHKPSILGLQMARFYDDEAEADI